MDGVRGLAVAAVDVGAARVWPEALLGSVVADPMVAEDDLALELGPGIAGALDRCAEGSVAAPVLGWGWLEQAGTAIASVAITTVRMIRLFVMLKSTWADR